MLRKKKRLPIIKILIHKLIYSQKSYWEKLQGFYGWYFCFMAKPISKNIVFPVRFLNPSAKTSFWTNSVW